MVITDVDECSEDTDGCSQTCSNTYGSFMCSCGSGFTLANDSLGCNGKNVCYYIYRQLAMYIDS